MAEDLPKQDLLLKMLNMTTVAEDTMAVVAIRKANALLKEAGWTWEKLLLGKIVVVADPFSTLKTPDSEKAGGLRGRQAPSTPPPPNTAPQARTVRPAPQPQRAPPPRQAPPQPKAPSCLSSKKNVYPGFCYNCGIHTPSEKGFVFNPNQRNARAPDKWVITCIKCNANVVTPFPSPAPKQNNSWTATPSAGPAPKLDSL